MSIEKSRIEILCIAKSNFILIFFFLNFLLDEHEKMQNNCLHTLKFLDIYVELVTLLYIHYIMFYYQNQCFYKKIGSNSLILVIFEGYVYIKHFTNFN